MSLRKWTRLRTTERCRKLAKTRKDVGLHSKRVCNNSLEVGIGGCMGSEASILGQRTKKDFVQNPDSMDNEQFRTLGEDGESIVRM